jgi:hypothetical protein
MIGKKYNKLLILRKSLKKYKSNGNIFYKCLCDCGKIKVINGDRIRREVSKSCGCLSLEKLLNRNTIHNMTHTKFYKIWQGIKERCDNISNPTYKYYGNRGIIYDSRWKDFLKFKEDMYFKYIYAKKKYGEKCLSIERIDVNGNYCFNNCIFIPSKEQNKNTRRNRWFEAISPEGKIYIEKNQSKFAREHKLYLSGINKVLQKEMKTHKNWKFTFLEMETIKRVKANVNLETGEPI